MGTLSSLFGTNTGSRRGTKQRLYTAWFLLDPAEHFSPPPSSDDDGADSDDERDELDAKFRSEGASLMGAGEPEMGHGPSSVAKC